MGGASGQTAGNVGMQGLGTLLNVVDLALAARHGQLGANLLARAKALQDPGTRESIAGSPLMAGFLGTYGSQKPTLVPGQPASASADFPLTQSGPETIQPTNQQSTPGTPDRMLQHFQANLPPLGPTAQTRQAGIEANLALKQGQLETQPLQRQALQAGLDYSRASTKMLGELGAAPGGGPSSPAPPTPSQAPGLLEAARARIYGGDISSGAAPASSPAPRKLRPRGASFGPSGASINFAEPKGVVVEQGTIGPGGTPISAVGTELPGGSVVSAIKPGRSGQASQRQLGLLAGALKTLELYESPVTDPKTGDTLTKSNGDPLTPIDVLPQGGGLGALGSMVPYVPGLVGTAKTRGAWPGTPENLSTARGTLRSLRGQVVEIIKAFGDTGNAAVQERLATIQDSLPSDDLGKGGSDTQTSARAKIATTKRLLQEIATALQPGRQLGVQP